MSAIAQLDRPQAADLRGSGLGRSESAREIIIRVPADFRLASGDRLEQTELRGRLTGPADAPVVIVAGGVSSDRFPTERPDGAPGWWADTVGPRGGVCTESHRILAFDTAPSVTEQAITITTTDQARLVALLLDAAGVDRAAAFVGASYGGMVALAFAAAFPERVGALVVLGAAHRAHPMATAWRGIQRRILQLGQAAGLQDEAVALARELAMTTYRSPEEFAARFDGSAPPAAGGLYPVDEYLTACGRKYPARMTPERWISLSDSMDRHRVEPCAVQAPTTLISFTSDRLVPPEDVRALAAALPRLEALHEVDTLFGHDGFLKETVRLAPLIAAALQAATLSPPSTTRPSCA